MPGRKGILHPDVQIGVIKLDPERRQLYVDTAAVSKKTKSAKLLTARRVIAQAAEQGLKKTLAGKTGGSAFFKQYFNRVKLADKKKRKASKAPMPEERRRELAAQLEGARARKAMMIARGIPLGQKPKKVMTQEVKDKLRAYRLAKKRGEVQGLSKSKRQTLNKAYRIGLDQRQQAARLAAGFGKSSATLDSNEYASRLDAANLAGVGVGLKSGNVSARGYATPLQQQTYYGGGGASANNNNAVPPIIPDYMDAEEEALKREAKRQK